MTDEHKAKISATLIGRTKSLATRARMSAAQKGKPAWNKGVPRTAEVKAKISAKLKGRIVSAEGRKNASLAHLGQIVSPEQRRKISVALMGHANWMPKHPSLETRAKLSAIRWKGGPTVSRRKTHAKRRTMGYVPLNPVFPGCEGHHIDNEQVIHMPKKLHQSVSHNHYTGRGMAQINAVAYNYLFKQEVETAMMDKKP